jgi:alpha-ketoglutaric semialdehyde dehydrogenase
VCEAAYEASVQMRGWPGDRFGAYLDAFADRIEKRAEELITTANLETAYPIVPRLQDVELPRTVNQLRQAADAARDGSWCNAVIETTSATGGSIRSMLGPIGPVCVFGPNNFPFAFNGAAGGDFAAAVAAGNPVIAKGHSSHPRTTQIFAEEAFEAARETGMPKAMIREARPYSRARPTRSCPPACVLLAADPRRCVISDRADLPHLARRRLQAGRAPSYCRYRLHW